MKIKALLVVGLFVMGLMLMSPQESIAQTNNNDVEVLFINQAESFTTIAVRDVDTQDIWEMRVAADHQYRNIIMAVLLTAVSLDEVIRIRWQEGNPPILLRAAINRLP